METFGNKRKLSGKRSKEFLKLILAVMAVQSLVDSSYQGEVMIQL
jgi:dUTPase